MRKGLSVWLGVAVAVFVVCFLPAAEASRAGRIMKKVLAGKATQADVDAVRRKKIENYNNFVSDAAINAGIALRALREDWDDLTAKQQVKRAAEYEALRCAIVETYIAAVKEKKKKINEKLQAIGVANRVSLPRLPASSPYTKKGACQSDGGPIK